MKYINIILLSTNVKKIGLFIYTFFIPVKSVDQIVDRLGYRC